MRKRVNFNFKLDEAMASLGSVLIYEVPLMNSLYVLRASTALASVSKASVVVDDVTSSTLSSTPTSVPEISKTYCKIRPAVNDKDILVWHAGLSQLSLPAIKRLPNAVRRIQLHANTPSTCTCKACILGKMFQKPFQHSDDKAKTRLLELIHSDVIGPMQTLRMRNY